MAEQAELLRPSYIHAPGQIQSVGHVDISLSNAFFIKNKFLTIRMNHCGLSLMYMLV